eukprot:GHRQ01037793.1.p2 GENE.GHRQ01037793.1~~GHRQ01037793.1.p2  ORF type:complete len:140 (-),score=18.86 GHRQ01037793.1:159-578(-)
MGMWQWADLWRCFDVHASAPGAATIFSQHLQQAAATGESVISSLGDHQLQNFAKLLPHLQLHVDIKEWALHVKDAGCCLAAQAALHCSKAALSGEQDGLVHQAAVVAAEEVHLACIHSNIRVLPRSMLQHAVSNIKLAC